MDRAKLAAVGNNQKSLLKWKKLLEIICQHHKKLLEILPVYRDDTKLLSNNPSKLQTILHTVERCLWAGSSESSPISLNL